MPKKLPNGTYQRFLDAAIAADTDKCILWPYAVDKDGYPISRKHRKACIAAHGQPPSARYHAAHFCNNRACVNPSHLRWASPRENILDKEAHGTVLRGEKHHRHKLTEEQVMAIFRDPRIQKEVAKAYGVSKATVCFIRDGKNWGWLTGKAPPAYVQDRV